MTSLNNNLVKKILIVGVGSMGKKYIQIIQDYYPEITIGVLRSSYLKKDFSGMHSIENIFESISDAISFSPDAVIFSNPASMHVESALPFAKKGVSLFIEKPLSTDYKEAKKLIQICEENKVICMMGYNLRYLPSLIKFRNLLHEKQVGEIYSVKSEAGSFLPNWRKDSDYRSSVSAQKSLGGGVLNELSHELDYIEWIFGSIKWVSATLTKRSNLEINVEDSCNMILGIRDEKKESDLIATLNLDFIRHDSTRNCLVTGSEGSLSWNGLEGTVKYYPIDGDSWEILYSNDESMYSTYIEEVNHFFNSIKYNNQPVANGVEGLQTLKVIEAAKKSSKSGMVINLNAKKP